MSNGLSIILEIVLGDFPFIGSSIAHLEPELGLFEVDDIGDDGDDDLWYHYLPQTALARVLDE